MQSDCDEESSHSLLSDSDVQPDFLESSSEGEHFCSSDEADAELFQSALEQAYSSNAPHSMLDPAERDSLLLFDKDLCEFGKIYARVLKGYAFS